MPRYKRPREEFRIGDYWLSRRKGRAAWHRTWYDAEAEQTRYASLGTDDFSEAKERLTEWFLARHRPHEERPEDVPLSTILLGYYEDHAKGIRSAEQQRIALALWNEILGPITVAELTPQRQNELVAELRRRGHSDGYISRTLSVGRAALNRAVKLQEITSAPFIFDVQDEAARRSRKPKGRPLSIEEMARLFNAASGAHVWMFLLILLNTMCRPDAARDLTVFQVDRAHGLVDLNPPGRKQTKKYRPIVPISETLAPWLERPEPARTRKGVIKPTHFVHYRGRPVDSMKTAWRALRVAAGFLVPNPEWKPGAPEDVPRMVPDLDVNPYSIRHTMGRELRKARVPSEEIELMLGHRPPGSRATATYAPYDPDYCRNAVRAIDAYCRRLQEHVERPLGQPPYRKGGVSCHFRDTDAGRKVKNSA